MLTPNGKPNEGKTKPNLFPAREEIIKFCKKLRSQRDISLIKTISLIKNLPSVTGASYKVYFHKPEMYIDKKNRKEYFLDIQDNGDQVIFVDPDIGFEPKNILIRYCEIKEILDQISEDSVISVYQHHRRGIKFTDTFESIKKRILEIAPLVKVTAIYRDHVMFILIGRSDKIIKEVIRINQEYSTKCPVKIIEN